MKEFKGFVQLSNAHFASRFVIVKASANVQYRKVTQKRYSSYIRGSIQLNEVPSCTVTPVVTSPLHLCLSVTISIIYKPLYKPLHSAFCVSRLFACSHQVAIGYFGTVLSISFFNFAGVSVTKELSATTRMVLDSVRTIVIWAFSLVAQWQQFTPLTLGGFVVLLTGMMLYNNVLIMPCLVSHGCVADPFAEPSEDDDRRELAAEDEDH